MTIFMLLSLLVSLAAVFSLISYRVLRLPATVGVMLLSLLSSAALILAGGIAPSLRHSAENLVNSIDFTQVVLHGMLAFLLFAGALHLDTAELARQRLPVAALAVAGTGLATVLIAALLFFVLRAAELPGGMMTCLLFGALISPTDPIAVLEMLRRVGAPKVLETQLTGESLFNDGIGAVIFIALLEASARGVAPHPTEFLWLMLVEAGGGLALGAALGYICHRLLRAVESYRVEILVTLALAMGGYALADRLHVSAPLEAVAAGLLISGTAPTSLTPATRGHVERFWSVVDDILNVILFLLLGLEILTLQWTPHYLYAVALTIPAVLLARWSSVGVVLAALRPLSARFQKGTLTVLTWAGLRGALSVALVLSIGNLQIRSTLMPITYGVVIFSILVQGLTVGPLLKRLGLVGNSS